MAQLTTTVVLRHPESGAVVPLYEGDPVPDWAASMLGDHVVNDTESEPQDKPVTRRRSKS